MDQLDMPPHVTLVCERPLASKVSADETYPMVNYLEMFAHVDDASKHLITGFIIARHRLGIFATLRWRRLPLGALGNMGFVVFLC